MRLATNQPSLRASAVIESNTYQTNNRATTLNHNSNVPRMRKIESSHSITCPGASGERHKESHAPFRRWWRSDSKCSSRRLCRIHCWWDHWHQWLDHQRHQEWFWFMTKQRVSAVTVAVSACFANTSMVGFPKILLEAFQSELQSKPASLVLLTIHHWQCCFWIFKNHCYLAVPFPQHAAVVDVGRACKINQLIKKRQEKHFIYGYLTLNHLFI